MHDENSRSGTAKLTLAALGVVYGDIGTSPLYAFKEAFAGAHAMPLNEVNVLATLSSLFWAIMLIVSLKYVWIVLRFSNDGEGGVLALTAMAQRVTRQKPALAVAVIVAGIFAAALFYGDAVITPAISVLSAIEGLSVATPAFEHWVEPITVGILIGLFVIQKHGTTRIGRLFGPVTVVWFLTLAVLGVMSIVQNPVVLQAINPLYAVHFAVQHPLAAFLLMSAVFLALTGGEALYADMGHFGARPVRLAWYGLVCPSLLLNYFGQGALVLRSADAVQNPFYYLAPDWLMLPLVGLAAAATVIASQATITGAYSMTLQATRLGYLPRVRVLHTSDTERGQIYVPVINWMMLIAVVTLVLQFQSSNALAAAYGIAVSGTMIITSVLTGIVALTLPGRTRWLALGALPVFFLMELVFFSSNATKLLHGGWMPIVLGMAIFTLLITWKKGSKAVSAARKKIDISMADFLQAGVSGAARVPGTAVYLTSDPELVPSALFHSLKHFKVMHEQIVFLHVVTEDIPRVIGSQRLAVKILADHVYAVTLRFGFREEPDVMTALAGLGSLGVQMEPMLTTFFVARASITEGAGALPSWQTGLFGWMSRQSDSAASYYHLPANAVVELGTQVTL
ncbi:MAG TPA: potassium transporter Kup [Pseudomonadales bacterium]|nr:potassium transporter Kup [Pseudomonadales bacterium]